MPVELNTLSYLLLTSIFSAASAVAIKNGRHSDVHPLVLNSQGSFSPLRYAGESAIIKSKMYTHSTLFSNNQTIHTLSQLYEVAFLKHKTNTFILSGQTVCSRYGGSLKSIQSIFSGLVNIANLVPCSDKESSFVGIYASTSPDAFMTEIACHWGGLVTIPIAAQATSSHLLHVIRNTSLTVLVIDASHLDFALHLIEASTVKHLIVLGNHPQEQREYFGIRVSSFDYLKKVGLEALIETSDQTSSDTMASIYYSSNPKNNIILDNKDDQNALGVVLTHRNMISALSSYAAHLPASHRITSKDRFMHGFAIDNVLGYILGALCTFMGATLSFEDKIPYNDFHLNVENVLSTIKGFRPTIYASGAPFLKQVRILIANKYGNSFIYQRGLKRKDRYHREGRLVSDCIYDMLVFRDIRQRMFGGNIRLLLIDDDQNMSDDASFYRAILGAQVLKTFSRAETTSGMTATSVYDYTSDKRLIGPPLPVMEIKLSDHEEYTAEDLPNPRGEIQVRGHNVFAGYWNDDKDTLLDVVHPDGWFITDMIGELLPNGSFLLLKSK
ncbi:uncharacterized protein EV154DRAFT_600251 [Mucor mucedo]|uniref:uncharacterized protein n=1 Tax=Mucor mucedo TaxID=29922 RepID=UPI00221FF43A|nr:uncharacterized protein EV154DRAFT_600251 [Mucor mucedo]KAI7894121.1 hypothetical protein EV154DRAFT_600251 [Mucor mucedo]